MLPNTPEGQKLANASRDIRETLQRNLANGNVELAAQMFVDSLNAPGTWATVPPERRQRLFDNLGTASQMSATPVTSCEQIAKFDFPILLVHGEKSPTNFAAMSVAMRKCKRVGEPIVVPNAAHNMFLDNPTVFNAALLGFLAHD